METRTIEKGIEELSRRLHRLAPAQLPISEYNQRYIAHYQDHFRFYGSAYRQLLHKATRGLDRPPEEATFIDYGGGCGILSFAAKLIGFKKVIYNDLYPTSVKDARLIAQNLDIPVEEFLEGDIDQLSDWLRENAEEPNLICSFDVLEHIYDLEAWFHSLSSVNGRFALFFMTSANPRNPVIGRRLKKLHFQAEYEGFERGPGWKESDTLGAFLEERKKLIRAHSRHLSSIEIDRLAVETRGLRAEDIRKVVDEYIRDGKINYRMDHPTNTCDPYTGNWAERLIDPYQLSVLAAKKGFKARISTTLYGYSDRWVLSVPKALLNGLISLLGARALPLSPAYVLELYR